MSDQIPPRKITVPKGGFLPELTMRIKLILRLMADGRINPLYKALPLASLVYLFVPTDLLPILPFDDALVLWLGGTLFIEICPQSIVQEHMNHLALEGQKGENSEQQPGEVVDAEFKDLSGRGE